MRHTHTHTQVLAPPPPFCRFKHNNCLFSSGSRSGLCLTVVRVACLLLRAAADRWAALGPPGLRVRVSRRCRAHVGGFECARTVTLIDRPTLTRTVGTGHSQARWRAAAVRSAPVLMVCFRRVGTQIVRCKGSVTPLCSPGTLLEVMSRRPGVFLVNWPTRHTTFLKNGFLSGLTGNIRVFGTNLTPWTLVNPTCR